MDSGQRHQETVGEKSNLISDLGQIILTVFLVEWTITGLLLAREIKK